MVTPPSIITDRHGRTVVLKSGRDELVDRRRWEADVLARARHPGIVELLDVVDDGEHIELHLEHVPGPTMADHPPLRAAHLVRIAAAVAETLADLHRAGLAHGHLAADHVLIAEDRFVLCGLADAVVADDADDATPADVMALAKLMRRQLDRSVEADVVDRTDPVADRLRTLLDEVVAEAELARDGDPAPTARKVASRLADIADAAGDGDPRTRRWVPRRIGGRTAVAAAAVLALTAVAALIGVRELGSDPTEAAESAPTTTSASTGTTAATPTTGPAASTTGGEPASTTSAVIDDDPTLVLAAPTTCAPLDDGWSGADVDGDGCPDPWRATDGVLEIGELRYSLGGAADLVAIGDWDCDATATPALVAVDSGGVFLFPRWATGDTDVTVEAVGVVDDPAAVEVTALDDCDVLDVTTPTGEQRFGGRS